MTDESTSLADSAIASPDAKVQPAEPGVGSSPWITRIVIGLCVLIFVGINSERHLDSWESLSKWGYLPAQSIRGGAYWGVVTCAFVHLALWHLAFNMYWLWVLGSRMECAIGSARFLAFVLTSAFVASSVELAVSDTTGIGASGFVYAIFGFMWISRQRFPQFDRVLTRQTIKLFVVWLFGCLAATYLEIWNVGNAAHFTGLLFGAGIANSFVTRRKPGLTLAATAAFVVCCFVSLVWCPWSVGWLSQKAYDAHAAKQFENARDYYSRIIWLDPKNAWAYQNRSYVFQSLGNDQEAEADAKKARALDPSIEKTK